MSEKIIDLEIRIAHLEKAQQELSDTFYAQQKLIDSLNKQLIAISEQLKSVRDAVAPDIIDAPPPHY